MNMPHKIRQEIQKRLQEIEAYRSHSLFKEARVRCQELAAFIKKTDTISSRKKLLGQLAGKIKKIDAELKTFDAFSESVEMSAREQQVVHKLFTSQKNDRTATDFEAATALQIFGQHEAAIKAFQALVDNDTHRIAAAKSIIRCHLGDGQIKKAVRQYLDWLKDNSFPPQALDSVRTFLQAVLEKKGYQQQLPEPIVIEEIQFDPLPEIEDEPDDFISIVLPYKDDRQQTQEAVLDVNYQSGNVISCIVPRTEKELLDLLKPGTKLSNVQINGADMITFTSFSLREVTKIRVGRYAGDTTITMRVVDD